MAQIIRDMARYLVVIAAFIVFAYILNWPISLRGIAFVCIVGFAYVFFRLEQIEKLIRDR